MFRRRALLAGNVHSAFHQNVLLKLCHRIVADSPVAMTYVDVNSGTTISVFLMCFSHLKIRVLSL